MYYLTKYDSPLGELFIVSDGDAIFKVSFTNNNEDCIVNDDLPIFNKVKKWFDDYFNGLNPKIDFKLNPDGSEFRLGVWNILSEIPYGQSVT